MDDRARRSLPVLPSPPPGHGPATGLAPAGGPGRAGSAAPGGAPGSGWGEGAGRPPVRVAMVTLGCDKNTVDSERILSGLMGAGVELAGSPEDADVVVVNTCGFIEIAKQESIDTLLDAARLKDAGRVRAVVGMGCLVQRYRTELEQEMPEIDLFLGLTDADRLVPELARRGLVDPDGPIMERPLRVLSADHGPAHTAHLKISEGCDHTCAFCAIPLMRGKFRSTPLDLLVREARELERRGAVELNVVSQDTTWYGRDWARALARGESPDITAAAGESYFLGRAFAAMPNTGRAPGEPAAPERRPGSAPGSAPGRDRVPAAGLGAGMASLRGEALQHLAGRIGRTGALPLLLETLLAETDVPWFRLFYMYPSGITRELVELMAREDRILPYLDMPIQHGSDRILQAMRRPERRETILERVGWLREAIPDLALRTTVIVGFPGETEGDFEELLDLLDRVRFDHVGAFAYSDEEDTLAVTMDGAVPAVVRRERLERLLDHQASIARERNEERIGRRATVLVDEVGDGVAMARAPWQAREVDGMVIVEGGGELEEGRFVDVIVTDADEHDLTARIAP